MSGKQARRRRQEQARPPTRSTGGRRASPKVLLAVAGAIALIAVAVVLAVVLGSGSGSTGTTGSTLPEADVVARQFKGIPQQGDVLGKASAPVTMVQYIDL